MWSLFKKRKEGDLPRLASAYRCYLKVADRESFSSEGAVSETPWKGGFGKAFNLLFNQWPTPNESRRFQKFMSRQMKKNQNPDDAFIRAFNDFLGQKPLVESEVGEVERMGRDLHKK
jgi:hypothetical protein